MLALAMSNTQRTDAASRIKQGTRALNRVSRERIDVGRHANGSAISVLLHETVRNLIHVRLRPLW